MKKNKILLLVAAASIATTTYIVLDSNNNTQLKAYNISPNQLVERLEASSLVNGHLVSTKEDALNYLRSIGINVNINDILEVIAPSSLKEIAYGKPGSTLQGYISKGLERVQSLQDLDEKSGWVENLNTNKHNIVIQIPINAKLKNGERVNKSNILTWLIQRAILSPNATTNDIKNFNTTQSTIVENNSDKSRSNLVKQGYVATGNKDTTKWIEDSNAHFVKATGENKPHTHETEVQYKERMSNKHISVRNFICSKHFNINGKVFDNETDARNEIIPSITINKTAEIDVSTTKMEITNLISGGKYTPSTTNFMLENNSDANNMKKMLATQFLGWYIAHNKVPGINLNDPQNKDIDWNFGLPKYIADYIFPTGKQYFMSQLGIQKDGTLGTPIVSDVSKYLADFDKALATLNAILDKIPTKNSTLNTLKENLKTLFRITDGHNQITNYSNLTDAYNAMLHNQANSKFIVKLVGNNTPVISEFSTFQEAQNFVNNNNNLYKFTLNGKDIQINGKSVFTQQEKDAISHGQVFQVEDQYFTSKEDAQKYAHSLLHQKGHLELFSFTNLTQDEKNNFEKQLANAKDSSEMNAILEKANELSQQHKGFSVYSKSDLTFSKPISSSLLTSKDGLDDLLNSLIGTVHATQSTTINTQGHSFSEKLEMTSEGKLLGNTLNIPSDVLNAQYNSKEDLINAIKHYIVLKDVDGNNVEILNDGTLHFQTLKKFTPVVDINILDVTSLIQPILLNNNLQITSNNLNKLVLNYDLGNAIYNPFAGALGEEFEHNGYLVPGNTEFKIGTPEELANILRQAKEFVSITDNTANNKYSDEFSFAGISSFNKEDLITQILNNNQFDECDAEIADQINPEIFTKDVVQNVEIMVGNETRTWEREVFEKTTQVEGRIVYKRSAPTKLLTQNNRPVVYVKKGTHELIENALQPKMMVAIEIEDSSYLKHTKIALMNRSVPGAPTWRVAETPHLNKDLNRWEIPATPAPNVITSSSSSNNPRVTMPISNTQVINPNKDTSLFTKNNINNTLEMPKMNIYHESKSSNQEASKYVRGTHNTNVLNYTWASLTMIISVITYIYIRFLKKR